MAGILRRLFQGRLFHRDRSPVSSTHSTDPATCKYLGNDYLMQGQYDMAELCYRKALQLDPDYVEALSNLGHVLTVKKKFSEAESTLRRALALAPGLVEAYNNLGTSFRDRGLFGDAAREYRACLALRPGYVIALGNLCATLVCDGCSDEAEDTYRQFLDTHPDATMARYYFSLCLLGAGKFHEGWYQHEARYDSTLVAPVAILPKLPFPRWTGQPLAEKSLLVWCEQGFGDEIQFVRYIPLLKKLGIAKIGLACPLPLRYLFESLAGVDQLYTVDGGIRLHRYDYWVLPLSIPLHCRTTLESIPASLPYLFAAPVRIAEWEGRLPHTSMRVGLVWRGNPSHDNDTHRSLPSLATLAPLLGIPGISFVNLQIGAGEDEAKASPAVQSLTWLGSEVRDFADTAAIVSQLDLVICVDTAIAHLAGALGTACWVMLPCVGTDWRWLQKRDDSPWYPGVMRLFRQVVPHDWALVIEKVAQALRGYVAARGRVQ